MKKHALIMTIQIALGVIPAVAFAAYTDVTMDSNTILTVAGVNLTVTAPTATLESITVDGSAFTLTMPGNSYLKITSADRRNISATGNSSVTITSTCTATESTYAYKSPAEVSSSLTFTVNVGADTCTTGGSAGGSSAPSGGGGGGGGGGYSLYASPEVSTAAVVTAKAVVTAPKATVSAPAAVAAIQANITRALAKGTNNPQVRVLQQILNSDSETRIATNGDGSPGRETNFFGPATLKAVQKFQVKYGIAKPGTEGYGVLGPKTRAKLNEIGGGAKVASPAQTTAIQKQIDDAVKQIQVLQEQLKKAK